MKNFNKIILSLGSNIDDRKLNLENAVKEISKIAKLIKISSIYESDPILYDCLLYTSPSPRDRQKSRMPSSA